MTNTLHIGKEKQLVPVLRFKEFEGDWRKNIIQDLANKITDGTHDTPKPTKTGTRYLTAIHVKDGFIDFENSYFLPKEEHSKIYSRCNPEKGDLLMVNIGAGTATSAMVCVDYEFSLKNVALIKPDNNKINPSFFCQVQRRNSLRQRHEISSGGAQPFLSLKAIGKLKLTIPKSLPEQKKIANFLSAIDQKIQQLTRKKALLEAYKKGLMQQLFSGALRFKPDSREGSDDEGKDYPDWEEKRLGDVGDLKNGLNKDKKDFGFGSPFVNLMDVFGERELNNKDFGLVNSNEKEKSLYRVLKGDVLFIRSSVKRTGVGEAVVVNEDLPQTVFSGFLIRFRDNMVSVNHDFKKYCFASYRFRKELLSYATTSANTNINQESLRKIKLLLPSEIEQQKIASYLSNIDTKIESINHQIIQTQTFKKGLLQQMFV